MLINCPFCGVRDHSEFSYGMDGNKRMPHIASDDEGEWVDYVYYRDNPKGDHVELWHHIQGCRQWVKVERNTLTHAVGQCELAYKVNKPLS